MIYHSTGSPPVLRPLYYNTALPVGSFHLELRQVLLPGDKLELAATAVPVHAWATGYVFDT